MALSVSDAQVAALRAFLSHATDEMAPLAYQLGDKGITGYLRLADTALSLLARRRFSQYTNADLVRYVASVRRARLADGDAYDINPVVGENVLRYSLGQQSQRTLDSNERFRAVVALMDALAETELSSEADLSELLAEARQLDARWLAGPSAAIKGIWRPVCPEYLSPGGHATVRQRQEHRKADGQGGHRPPIVRQ